MALTLQQMTQKLMERGYSQDALSQLVNQHGVKCTQNQISRIVRGFDARYQLGDVIRTLFIEEYMRPKNDEEAA